MVTAPRKPFHVMSSAAVLVAGLLGAPPAHAADNPYERGPAPTEQSVTAATGPFAVASQQVSRSSVTGFGGGVIYYPTDGGQTYGAIALVPGFTGTWSSISWLGPRLASQGFVVIGVETKSTLDFPAGRGDQLLAALNYVAQSSSVRGRVDGSRLAVGGHSMGGGGSLEAAKDRTSLKAVVPLAPWSDDKTWPEIASPTMIIGAKNDGIAGVSSHAIPIYNGISAAPEKAYLELNNEDHWFPEEVNANVAKYMISWFKRWVDNDTRYTQFLCPPPSTGAIFSGVRSTCPM